jgi:hypothetical protein
MGRLVWGFETRPTVLSRSYTVRILYKQGGTPAVFVTEPDLAELAAGRDLPHVYAQKPARLWHRQDSRGCSERTPDQPASSEGLFGLDDVSKVDRLAGMGAECARDALPLVRREFLGCRREDFIPFHGCRSAGDGLNR